MDTKIKAHVRQILEDYLVANKCRRTPERYAILDAIYSLKGHFTINELNDELLKNNFRVSRATLYNALKLFISMHLVVKHIFPKSIKYEAGYQNSTHCHQICTICWKSEEVNVFSIEAAVNKMRLKRFHKEGFVLYIYGICRSCQSKAIH